MGKVAGEIIFILNTTIQRENTSTRGYNDD